MYAQVVCVLSSHGPSAVSRPSARPLPLGCLRCHLSLLSRIPCCSLLSPVAVKRRPWSALAVGDMSSQAVYCHGLCSSAVGRRWSAALRTRKSSSSSSSNRRGRVLAVLEKDRGAQDSALENGSLLNKYSSRITQPASQGASQAMLYAIGLSEEDMNKPQVGDDWY